MLTSRTRLPHSTETSTGGISRRPISAIKTARVARQLESVRSEHAGVDVVNIVAHSYRDFPWLRRNIVADPNADRSTGTCYFRRQCNQQRAAEIPDRLLVEWLARKITATSLGCSIRGFGVARSDDPCNSTATESQLLRNKGPFRPSARAARQGQQPSPQRGESRAEGSAPSRYSDRAARTGARSTSRSGRCSCR